MFCKTIVLLMAIHTLKKRAGKKLTIKRLKQNKLDINRKIHPYGIFKDDYCRASIQYHLFDIK